MQQQPSFREIILELQADIQAADTAIHVDIQFLSNRVARLEESLLETASRNNVYMARYHEDFEQLRIVQYELNRLKEAWDSGNKNRQDLWMSVARVAIALLMGGFITYITAGIL